MFQAGRKSDFGEIATLIEDILRQSRNLVGNDYFCQCSAAAESVASYFCNTVRKHYTFNGGLSIKRIHSDDGKFLVKGKHPPSVVLIELVRHELRTAENCRTCTGNNLSIICRGVPYLVCRNRTLCHKGCHRLRSVALHLYLF